MSGPHRALGGDGFPLAFEPGRKAKVLERGTPIGLRDLAQHLGLRSDRLGALIRRHELMPGHRKGARYHFSAEDVVRIASHPKIESVARKHEVSRREVAPVPVAPESPAVEPVPRKPESTRPEIEAVARTFEATRTQIEPVAREPALSPNGEPVVAKPEASRAEIEPVARQSEMTLAEIAHAEAPPRALPWALAVPAVALALTAAGLFLWAVALPDMDLGRMNDAGLVSVLPPQVFVALGLVTAGFLTTLHVRPAGPLLLMHVAALVVILFGTTSIVEHVPHISATWRHVGIVDYINRTHRIDTRIDAYFNWPGFFIFSAFLGEVAGVHSTIGFARWAPLVYDLLFLLPVFLIARASSADRRLVWTTVWLFSITNWVAQDYFSPQATTYLLYLVAVALLLSWFATKASAPVASTAVAVRGGALARARSALRLPATAPRGTALQRVVVLLILIVVIAATVPSHQLTPFALFAAVTGLVAVRACKARGLPLLVLAMIAAWVVFMTGSFLSGHFGSVAGSVGKVDQNVSSSLGGRLHGSPEHLAVVFTRVALTGGLWLLALVGFVRRFRKGYRDLQVAALALAPFMLIALQSYGGEILLRIYLFALPFMAFFSAAVFFTASKASASWRVSVALGLVSVALVAGFLVSRYGNEQTDYFTQGEVRAVEHVNRIAPVGSLLVSLTRDYPRKFVRYEQFRYAFVSELPRWGAVEVSRTGVRAAVRMVRGTMTRGVDPRGSYLIVTRSQVADLETFSDVRTRWLEALVNRLRSSPAFQTLYANRDAFVLQLRGVERP